MGTICTRTLEVGHVSVPVKVCGAGEKQDVSLGRAAAVVEKRGGKDVTVPKPIRRIEVPDPGPDVEELTIQLRRVKGRIEQQQFDGDIMRGVWEGDQFYEIKPSEIATIDELTHLDTITIQEFVPLADIPWERAQAAYFLAPAEPTVGALKALALLRDAMVAEGVAGVAKLVPKSRQKLALVYPAHGGLMVSCLTYANTFEKVIAGAAAFADGVEVKDDALALMRELIVASSEPVEALDPYRDDLIELHADLVERAKLGEPLTPEEEPEAETEEPAVSRLEEALRASILEARARKAAANAAAKKAKPRKSATSKRSAAAVK